MQSDRARHFAEAEALFRKKDDARPQATRAHEEYLAGQRAWPADDDWPRATLL